MNKSTNLRLTGIFVLIMVITAGILLRLAYIQLVKNEKYATLSRRQSERRQIIPSGRGAIRDRNGTILAQSLGHSVTVPSHHFNDNIVTMSSDSITLLRYYPLGKLAAQVIGYTGRDGNGLAGVEFAFDRWLRGEDGWYILQKDGKNRKYARVGGANKVPVRGADVYLTIDASVQAIAEKVVAQTVKNMNAKSGMCVIMDPYSGDILAMVNEPGFNPTIWKAYPEINRTNRCISYNYEPGSTFKVITAAAALHEGVLSEDDTIDGNLGVYEVYNQVIRDHDPLGKTTFAEALALSSNVCFAKIANQVGNERFYRYTRDFGFGSATSIDLPGEEVGIVHPIEKWSGRTRVTMAMGHEISATMIQMMTAYCAVANDGRLIRPRIYSKIVNADGSVAVTQRTLSKRQILSPETAIRLRRMMGGVVDHGTAKRAKLPHVKSGGKTGTAQKVDEKGSYSNSRYWASFIGFIPVEKPALVCGIMIDEPAMGETGGIAAAPGFREIFQEVICHPDLDYTLAILAQRDSLFSQDSGTIKRPALIMPNLEGLAVTDAASRLKKIGIHCEIVGRGSTIRTQVPKKNARIVKGVRAVLYTGKAATGDIAISHDTLISTPNCVGIDLRDAVNMLKNKGLRVSINGAGKVISQHPTLGTILRPSDVCSLYCRF